MNDAPPLTPKQRKALWRIGAWPDAKGGRPGCSINMVDALHRKGFVKVRLRIMEGVGKPRRRLQSVTITAAGRAALGDR